MPLGDRYFQLDFSPHNLMKFSLCFLHQGVLWDACSVAMHRPEQMGLKR
ncbi:MAG: hypothetical protein PWQ99_86 [Clostridia bacterium]|nr:hypothetical protein [Clostridia bacterium]MDN5366101.1 hypothetical protein [Thermacetogenium sp.]